MSPISVQLCMQYSSIALLYYDYTLTFPSEVKYMWRTKFRISTFLYVCCRYALLANVLYLLAIVHVVDKVPVYCSINIHKLMHRFSVRAFAALLTPCSPF
ncbi:hypothetical protein BV22DRAFT_231290 [Leucogyrophana mollusca]|uniref:Uncharacterized protein n=1 Tax=Leucogyrophana mollusca TaxID=85980 RepID=A0ACB8BR05_9AGAM|nr:hypothetical protein BV22DRAFT_231290 [Leucogyrophana mollusca]